MGRRKETEREWEEGRERGEWIRRYLVTQEAFYTRMHEMLKVRATSKPPPPPPPPH